MSFSLSVSFASRYARFSQMQQRRFGFTVLRHKPRTIVRPLAIPGCLYTLVRGTNRGDSMSFVAGDSGWAIRWIAIKAA